MAEKPSTAGIQERSTRLRKLVTVLSVSLWILLVLERFSAVTIQLFAHAFSAESLRRLALEFVIACPEVFYLLALWWIRQALAAFAQGKLFAPTIIRMLHRVGVMLAIGAFLNVFLLPAIERALGLGPGYWVAFDVSGLVLGVIGLTLNVIARVFQLSADMQAELNEIF